MTPLALIIQARGGRVEGSDRALDQGRNAERFDFLRARGVLLHPQDGSGIRRAGQILVTSTAVEETVPDVQAARRIGAAVTTRARLLAELFNRAALSVGVAGTSGKSTTVGMIGWILHRAGKSPTIMNGADMKNFIDAGAPFASARVGDGEHFRQRSGRERRLDRVFRAARRGREQHLARSQITGRAARPVPRLHRQGADGGAQSRQRGNRGARGRSEARASGDLQPACCASRSRRVCAGPVAGRHRVPGEGARHRRDRRGDLKVPGLHNVANALAALSAAKACGVALAEAAAHLGEFSGIRRRLEVVGTANEITVIDDFAHNPDKIAATLETMHAFPGRLLLMFQPHGYGPIRLMRNALVDCFASGLRDEDVLVMPEPVYFGGTVDRSVGSRDIVGEIERRGRKAFAFPDRSACGDAWSGWPVPATAS